MSFLRAAGKLGRAVKQLKVQAGSYRTVVIPISHPGKQLISDGSPDLSPPANVVFTMALLPHEMFQSTPKMRPLAQERTFSPHPSPHSVHSRKCWSLGWGQAAVYSTGPQPSPLALHPAPRPPLLYWSLTGSSCLVRWSFLKCCIGLTSFLRGFPRSELSNPPLACLLCPSGSNPHLSLKPYFCFKT